jgi:hypothetical protein
MILYLIAAIMVGAKLGAYWGIAVFLACAGINLAIAVKK